MLQQSPQDMLNVLNNLVNRSLVTMLEHIATEDASSLKVILFLAKRPCVKFGGSLECLGGEGQKIKST